MQRAWWRDRDGVGLTGEPACVVETDANYVRVCLSKLALTSKVAGGPAEEFAQSGHFGGRIFYFPSLPMYRFSAWSSAWQLGVLGLFCPCFACS